MHEIVFASKVLREAKKEGATNFLMVEVGELCEITGEELEEALIKLTNPNQAKNDVLNMNSIIKANSLKNEKVKNTDLILGNKWEIKVNQKESRVKCKCGYIGRARIIDRGHGYCIFNCPKCGGKADVEEGGEIKIIQIG